MIRIFALSSAVDPTGSVKQFELARPLLRERFEIVYHTLERGQQGERASRAAFTDARAGVLHTLGADAFRVARSWATAALSSHGSKLPPWVAAGAATEELVLGFAPGLTATVSQSEHERDWAARLMPTPMQFSLPVAVTSTRPIATKELGGECHSPSIVAAGGFDDVANLKHAVWAFDVLKYAHPKLRLVIVGDGPQRTEIAHLACSLGGDDLRVECIGHHQDITSILAHAVQAWSTHTRGGTKFLLEAMALRVPTIAVRTPDTERVIQDGVNGMVVPNGRPVEIARTAHGLLAAPDRARSLVAGGGLTAARYPAADLADALAGVYHTLSSSDSPRSE